MCALQRCQTLAKHFERYGSRGEVSRGKSSRGVLSSSLQGGRPREGSPSRGSPSNPVWSLAVFPVLVLRPEEGRPMIPWISLGRQ